MHFNYGRLYAYPKNKFIKSDTINETIFRPKKDIICI